MIKRISLYLCFAFTSIANINAIPFTGHGVSGLRALYNTFYVEADFNNDGYLDIFAAGNDGTSDYSEIYLNNKDLTFTLLPTSIPQLSNVSADVADFNGDGYVDIAISGLNAGLKYCNIFKNNGDNTFTAIATPIENMAYGSVLWVDFNNDGIMDLFTCGINQAGNYLSHIYKGGNNTFKAVSTNVIPVSGGRAVILDYNNDMFVDIALTGYNSSGQIVSYLFKNNWNFTFESVNAGFERVTNGDMVAADIDGDGNSDVIITGVNHLGKKITQLYSNNNGVFVRSATANLDSLSSSHIRTADFNNDGYLDILLTGTDNRGFYNTILYTNNHDYTFTKISTLFPALTMANAAIADFDKDNDVDILLSGKGYTGNYVNFYTNDVASGNIAPSVPASLMATAKHDSVTLAWNRATDNETPVNGLSYNLYLGKSSGIYDLIAPASALGNGNRKVMKIGNAFQNNSLLLKGLPEGMYYCSVQSIDNNYEGSAFATESSFTICHNLFVGQDTTVCKGDTVTLHAGSGADVVNWFSLANGLLASNNNQVKYVVNANDKVIVELTNQWGCVLHDTIDLKIMTLPVVKLGNDTSICYQSAITLNVGSGWKKTSWFNGSNQLIAMDTSKYKYFVIANATFAVAITDNNGCKNRDTINIIKYNLPTFTIGADKSLCFNDTAKLAVNTQFPEIKWYKIRGVIPLASGLNYNFKITGTDTLQARVHDLNGCANNDTVVVNMLPLPDIRLAKDTSICFGEDVTITANKKFNHMDWTSENIGHPVSDTLSIRFKVKVTDYIKINVSDIYGCKNSDTLIVTKFNLPVFNIGPDTSNCVASEVLFNAKPGWKRVDWYKTGNALLLADEWFYKHFITENTDVWARVVDNNNCVNYDTVNIVAYPLPQFSLGIDTSLCKNNVLKLSTNNAYTNTVWRSALDGIILNGPNSMNLQVTQNDVISADVTDVHLCRSIDTIKITMFQPPALNLGLDTIICNNSRLSLNAGNNWKSARWFKKSTGEIYNNTALYEHVYNESDTLAIHVADENGCNAADTLVVKVAPLPKFNLGRDTSICAGMSLTFFINNDYNVKWLSAKSGFLSNNNTISKFAPLTTDTLVAKANSSHNCEGADTIVIKINALPLINAGIDTTVCYGSSLILGANYTATGNDPFMYDWTPQTLIADHGASNPVIEAKEDKTYFVKVTDRYKCENIDSVKIQVNPQTIIQLPEQLAICRGQKISLGQSPVIKGSKYPYTFHWSPDSTISANNVEVPVASPMVTNNYRLIASTWKCMADTAYITVVVRNLPTPYVSPTLTIGNEGSVQLYAEGGSKYRWRPADNLNRSDIPDPVAHPDESTLYTVEVIDTFGCSSEAGVQINVRNEVFVPEIFTPNNDGKNDVFKLYGFGFVELSLVIYDRYNNKVYESIDMNGITSQGWDGTYKGKALEQGIYRWIIKGHFANGQTVLVKGKNTGIVSLVR